MGLEAFIPEIWSAKLFVRLRKTLVAASIVTREYEGEITAFGDTVKINEIGPVTVNDYTKYTSLTWQELDAAQKELKIDQAKSFSFTVDDIDTAQQKPKVMNAALSEAAYAIADTIDQFILGLNTEAGVLNTTNLGSATSGISTSSGNVIENFSYAARYLDEANVPRGNRFAVIAPWVHQKLILAEAGGISATAVPKVFDSGVLTSGFAGQVAGFNILVSNNVVTTSTVYHNMFLTPDAIAYAGQIIKVQAVERESYFDTGVKGLYVYGGKVVRPNALAVGYWSEASG